MSKESIQKKLTRVRPPRVQISYEVEVGDALQARELPCVIGVMGDFSGSESDSRQNLRDRSFMRVDRDNFNEVMAKIAPSISLRVANKIDSASDSQIVIERLSFKSLDDFHPDRLVDRIPSLEKMMVLRGKLADLRNKLLSHDRLEDSLTAVLTEQRLLAHPSVGGSHE